MKYLLSIFCFLALSKVSAQKNYQLNVSLVEADPNLLKSLQFKSAQPDSITVYQTAALLVSQLQFQGYLLAEVEKLVFNDRKVQLLLRANKQYQLVALSAKLPSAVLQSVGFRERNFRAVNFNPKQLTQLFESLLVYYENNGYPFAAIGLDSIMMDREKIAAQLKVQPNQRITYDSVQVVGSAKIGQKYLQNYLNIRQGDYYAEKYVGLMENRLRELPFLEVVKSPEIGFANQKALIRVYANKKDANQFDGILGLQQNGSTGKSQLVGNLKLHLYNAFKRAEQLDFNYQGLAGKSQLLELKANVPHVLNTEFGLSPSLYLYKQDTSFLNVDTKLGFNYLLKGNNALQFFIENKATSLVSVEGYQNATVLPPILDAGTTFYGLGLNLEQLDYRFNPRKGYTLSLDFAVGAKKIKRNAAIPEALYQNVTLNSTSYRLFSRINYYVPLAKQLVVALSNETAFLNGKYLLENEVFRLGGQKSLRGFNELSILATGYAYVNAELRYLLERNSFLFIFYNQAYVKRKTADLNYKDYPLGFGTGINFETNLGILSVSYALGKQQNNPLNLRQGKIHFGITALF